MARTPTIEEADAAGVALAVAAFGAAFVVQARAADKVLTMAVPGDAALDNLDPRVLLSTSYQAVQMAPFDSLLVRRH